jgi:hypothetical protein
MQDGWEGESSACHAAVLLRLPQPRSNPPTPWRGAATPTPNTENMRREGFELSVSPPRVVLRQEEGGERQAGMHSPFAPVAAAALTFPLIMPRTLGLGRHMIAMPVSPLGRLPLAGSVASPARFSPPPPTFFPGLLPPCNRLPPCLPLPFSFPPAAPRCQDALSWTRQCNPNFTR